MSKRVANTRARTARYGRVRIGWRKHRMLSMLEQQSEQATLGNLDEKATAAFEAFKKQVHRIVPKVFLRRAQSR